MQIKRLIHLVAVVVVSNVLATGVTNAAIDVVVVTGSKCGDSACKTGPFYDQQQDYDPYAAPTGGGNPAGAIASALRDAARNYEPTCVPAGSDEQAHRAAQAGLCAAKAIAEVSRTLGLAASAVSADTARQACLAEVGEKLAVGACKSE